MVSLGGHQVFDMPATRRKDTSPPPYRVKPPERNMFRSRIYALGYTQSQAAAAIGRSPSELSRWLTGQIVSAVIHERLVAWLERREAARQRRQEGNGA